MIPRTVPTWQIQSWQDELKQLIVTPEALLTAVGLGSEWLPAAKEASKQFKVSSTLSYASRIKRGDPNDPLLRQILPLEAELHEQAGFIDNPLQEDRFSPLPGIIHKYQSRVLFIAATHCAINCRYCFRRHFPYEEARLSREDWLKALAYIAHNPSINEVILSGGDPLSLSDRQLCWLKERISEIPHIKRLRIHSRYPIILPSRITADLVDALTTEKLQTIIVSHCNHPQEIDSDVKAAFSALKRGGFWLFNQSVLLKNINDNSTILATLSESLFECGVLPYYLHLLDPVKGAAHFAVDDQSAKQIYQALLAKLPGFLAPKLVRETPCEASKTPIGLA